MAYSSSVRGERGAALVLALVATMLLLTLGGAMVMLTATESAIAASFRDGIAALYAADGAVEQAIAGLGAVPDWDEWLAGLPPAPDPPWRQLPAAASGAFSIDVAMRGGPGAGVFTLRGRASGARGVQRTVEAVVSHAATGVRFLTWREAR